MTKTNKRGRVFDRMKRLVRHFGFVPSAELERSKSETQWYKQRVEILAREQKRMRDPERTLVCDILANGGLLADPSGRRYPPND